MKTSFQRIVTKDGLELAGLLYEPDGGTKKVLVHVHGMAGNFYENKFLDFLAATLTANGIAFFAFNNRGCEYIKDLVRIKDGERNFLRVGDSFEKFEDCVLDIEAGIDFAEAKGFTDIHLSGHSLGSPKVAYYVSETKDARLKSILFLSPADMVGLAKQDKDYDRDITTARKMITDGKGGELMPFEIWGTDYLSANAFDSLSDENSKVAIFNFYNPNDTLPVLGKITLPTITIMGRKDPALSVTIDETMNRVKAAMIASPKVETNILGDADHIYTNHEQQLADAVTSWISKN